ncbi:MAG: class F sortase [Acidimicrobiales bacterium]
MRLISASALLVAAGFGLGLYGVISPPHVQPPSPRGRQVEALRLVKPGVPGVPVSPRAAAHPSAGTSARVVSAPVSIVIPALRISSSLGPARGLKPNGAVDDAPLSGPTWSLPWWYKAGPAPGEAGSAVILGHVDSALGAGHIGVFFRLGDAIPGDGITVTLANGSVTSWVVTSVRLYPDNQFPDAFVYERSGPPMLRLVTCGGAFNYQSHAYQSALVLSARLVSGP